MKISFSSHYFLKLIKVFYMVSATFFLLLIFIILKIVRVIYVKKNLLECAKRCENIAEQYLNERWSVAGNKRDKIIKSIFTPTIIKALKSKSIDDFVENTSETIINELPLFKISKGILEYYKKDDYIEYLKDRYMLFSQPMIKIENYTEDVISYFIIILVLLVLATMGSEEGIDFSTLTFYLMFIPILSSIYKLINLKSLNYKSDNGLNGIIIQDYKAKYIFTPTDKNKITVDVNNKIMKKKFTYQSKYI